MQDGWIIVAGVALLNVLGFVAAMLFVKLRRIQSRRRG